MGNFSDEEVNGNSISQENSIEYPLQRDEVQTANKGERNHVTQSKCSEMTRFGGALWCLKDEVAFLEEKFCLKKQELKKKIFQTSIIEKNV